MKKLPATALLVDPDSAEARQLVEYLRARGFRVLWAQDGETANNILDAEPIDCLLCELRAPRVDGLTLLQRARKRNAALCAVMMTRGADVETAEGQPEALEATMQTRENNIVRLSFEVQYKINDAFAARYRLADPQATLRDAAQSAIREVVGGQAIEGVLSEDRGLIGDDTRKRLQDILDGYGAGISIQGVQLKDAQPPAPVRAAFDDVIAAQQDATQMRTSAAPPAHME